MMPERVDEMLAAYKECVGRCKYLKLQIELYTSDIERLKREAAENLAYASGNGEQGMPRGSSVGNPTERMGIMLASGYEPPELTEKKSAMIAMQEEHREKMLVVHFVEAWLEGLTEKERWMITGKVFEGKTYRELIFDYRNRYGENCSRDKLRELRKAAMKKIYDMAS